MVSGYEKWALEVGIIEPEYSEEQLNATKAMLASNKPVGASTNQSIEAVGVGVVE